MLTVRPGAIQYLHRKTLMMFQMLPTMHESHSSDKNGPGCWFLLLLLCLFLWSELCYMPSHRQNKSLCLPHSHNWMVTEAELLPLCKLTEIISSVHFSQVLPCSVGRNYHYKLPLLLQKKHIWLFFHKKTGMKPGEKKYAKDKMRLICIFVTWSPLHKNFSFLLFPAKILPLCACPN